MFKQSQRDDFKIIFTLYNNGSKSLKVCKSVSFPTATAFERYFELTYFDQVCKFTNMSLNIFFKKCVYILCSYLLLRIWRRT